MGYADKYYFGQAKLIVNTDLSGVAEATDGNRTWTAIVINGSAVFTLPGTNKYTIKVDDMEEEVYLNYGECKSIEVGMVGSDEGSITTRPNY